MSKNAPENNTSVYNLFDTCSKIGHELRKIAKQHDIILGGTKWVRNTGPISTQIEQIKNLLNRVPFSDQYKYIGDKCIEDMANTLSASNDFRLAAKNWPHIGQNAQEMWAIRIGEMVQDRYSNNSKLFSPLISTFCVYSEPRPDDPDIIYERGSAEKVQSLPICMLSFNRHSDTGFNDFMTAMDVIFHENLHAIQFALIQHYFNEQYRNHPLFHDMKVFFLSGKISALGLETIYPIYRADPMERDTFSQSYNFTQRLKVKLGHD